MFLFNLLLNIFYLINSFSINPRKNFFKKYLINNELNPLINKDNTKSIILNGDQTSFKKDYCKIICDFNNLNFKEFTFNHFIEGLPYNLYNNTLLYINDFLINNGRILNSYEESILLNIPKTSNLIILEAENIEIIPYKDIHLINKFKVLHFPKISKKEIINYIYDNIIDNNYSESIYFLNWARYKDIEKLSLEKINQLLFDLNLRVKDHLDNNIELMIHNLLLL